ncbi:hypothetical protein QWZ13_16260 [Reinekea marina]|uniref:DUF432 domain-containing protein n=1 Tax=Reinekea marina TaxID=1310421 RepID=A0ABV7WS66_9GAMM|nr:hypothetical protein [Reinekea marina]MDN3650463.1 hypothetical protein [Reinekea marina]
MQVQKPWWGAFQFEVNEAASWSIGSRQFVLRRLQAEWNIWNVDALEEAGVTVLEQGKIAPNTLPDDESLCRYLFKATESQIIIQPALADRSITSRPSRPLNIMPGETGRLYVSTPLWFQVTIAPEHDPFFDQPFWRPSDSWFGPTTIEGEMCYSKHTDARLNLELIERRTHRAITPVNVVNDSNEVLVIDQFNLPVPMLSLFSDRSGYLWTEALTVTREQDEDSVVLTLDKSAPSEAGEAQRVAAPRIEVSKHRLIRSLSSLFA